MRSSFDILIFFLVCATASCDQSFLQQIMSSALMGDILASIPARFHCMGAGKNFTHFMLYSRIHPDKHRPLVADDRDLLYKSDFDPTIPTKVILHGFIDNMHTSDWIQRMKSKFLSTGDYNIIVVDWSCGNEFPYSQAIQNSKVTARELTKLITFLQDTTGADPTNFHLIGHSLGSHIAALVGHGVPHLGRISALDPAGPRFYDAPLEERLDPGDALFIDAIHTDAGHGLLEGLGLRSQVGHVDFYPNGGKDQPGCHNSPFSILPRIGLHRAARYYITCDHFRSVEYYIDSIRNPIEPRVADGHVCEHVGVACRDWETYAQGRCTDCTHPGDCAMMGYLSDVFVKGESHSLQHEYYVKTADEDPFCLFQYQVIVETGCGHSFCTDASHPGLNPGAIRLELKAHDGKLTRLNLDDQSAKQLKPGAQYVYLATSRFPIGDVLGAKVWWGYMAKPEVAAASSSSLTRLSLKKIQLFPIHFPEKIKPLSNAQPQVMVLCGPANKTIRRNQYLELDVNNC